MESGFAQALCTSHCQILSHQPKPRVKNLPISPNYESQFVVSVSVITSAEEGGYVFTSVCLSVCLSVCPSGNWKSCKRILTKFLGGVGHAQRPMNSILVTIRITIRIWESVPYHDPDPGRTAKLSTHTEQMPCKIIQQFYYAGVRRRSVLYE